MIKSELIQLIAQQNPHLYHRDERIINTIFDDHRRPGARRPRRAAGVWSVFRRRAAMPGRGAIREPATRSLPMPLTLLFKTGKELRDKLNEEAG